MKKTRKLICLILATSIAGQASAAIFDFTKIKKKARTLYNNATEKAQELGITTREKAQELYNKHPKSFIGVSAATALTALSGGSFLTYKILSRKKIAQPKSPLSKAKDILFSKAGIATSTVLSLGAIGTLLCFLLGNNNNPNDNDEQKRKDEALKKEEERKRKFDAKNKAHERKRKKGRKNRRKQQKIKKQEEELRQKKEQDARQKATRKRKKLRDKQKEIEKKLLPRANNPWAKKTDWGKIFKKNTSPKTTLKQLEEEKRKAQRLKHEEEKRKFAEFQKLARTPKKKKRKKRKRPFDPQVERDFLGMDNISVPADKLAKIFN